MIRKIKPYTFLILTFLFLSNLSGQEPGYKYKFSKDVDIDFSDISIQWISHLEKEYRTEKTSIVIKVGIKSKYLIDSKNIKLKVNNISSFKAEEAELFPKTEDSQIYKRKLFLPFSKNEILLSIYDGRGNLIKQSSKLIFHKINSNNRPNLHILAIGPSFNDLEFTEEDAKDFVAIFENQGSEHHESLFQKIKVLGLLTGKRAKGKIIADMVTEIATNINEQIKKEDVFILFVSSHGKLTNNERFLLLGSDYKNELTQQYTTVAYADLLNWLDELPCKAIIFIDACHSGTGKNIKNRTNFEKLTEAVLKLNQSSGVAVITSSGKRQVSFEHKSWFNGAFTEGIIEGLKKGKADGFVKNNNSFERKAMDGIITLNELYNWLAYYVPKIVKKEISVDVHQNPVIITKGLGDIPLYITKN